MFQSHADRERGEVEHLLNDLSGSLDQIRSHVVGGIVTQLDAVMTKGDGMVNRLEEELSQLTERRAALEAQATSQDHIAFLKVRTPAVTDPRITTEACFITPLHHPSSSLRHTRRPRLLWPRICRPRRMTTRSWCSTSIWAR